MKKFLALLCVCCLVGCSNKAPEKATKVCKGDLNGVEITHTYELEDDKIVKQTTENRIDVTTLGLDEETLNLFIEQMEESMADTELTYDVKGVSYEHSVSKELLTEKITIDYLNSDMDDLIKAGLIESKSGSAAYVSYEMTMESLEQSGFVCE